MLHLNWTTDPDECLLTQFLFIIKYNKTELLFCFHFLNLCFLCNWFLHYVNILYYVDDILNFLPSYCHLFIFAAIKAKLTRMESPPLFGQHIKELAIDAEMQTKNRLRFKVNIDTILGLYSCMHVCRARFYSKVINYEIHYSFQKQFN